MEGALLKFGYWIRPVFHKGKSNDLTLITFIGLKHLLFPQLWLHLVPNKYLGFHRSYGCPEVTVGRGLKGLNLTPTGNMNYAVVESNNQKSRSRNKSPLTWKRNQHYNINWSPRSLGLALLQCQKRNTWLSAFIYDDVIIHEYLVLITNVFFTWRGLLILLKRHSHV